jgi:Domain of unknown function (DUF1905)
VDVEWVGEVIVWRGPAPYFFIRMPDVEARALKTISGLVTYGWGVIPATVRIGATQWNTSLFPKDGGYLVPIKDVVRRAEGLVEGDRPVVRLAVRR